MVLYQIHKIIHFQDLDECLNASLYSIRATLAGHSTKRLKADHLKPIVFVLLRTSLGQPKPKMIRALLDTGATKTIVSEHLVTKLRVQKDQVIQWSTAAGTLITNQKVKLQFVIPELHDKRTIQWEATVTKNPVNYDMIIGLDLLTELGIQLSFEDQTITWDDSTIPMKSFDAQVQTAYHVEDNDIVEAAMDRIKRIQDAKYAPANLDDIVAQCDQLDASEKAGLRALLEKYKSLFDGTLGKWIGETYDIELKPDAKPYHAKPFPVPKFYEQTLKLEVARLVKEGVLKPINRSVWAAPTFIIPKKDKTVRFISDFRELNKRIKRKPFPLPKIQDLMLKLEGFQFATSLDLNMGYYHIELSPFSKELCTIVLPWGKFEYQRLPMGLCNSPDIFQEKMSILMQGLDFVRTYLDDVLCLTCDTFEDHLKQLDKVLQRLLDAGLKVNAPKSHFAQHQVEYLGYWITREGVQPLPNKIMAIQKIATPKTRRELRRFIGIVNYYRDMWPKRSETLAPLSRLCSPKQKWRWTSVEESAFTSIKKIVARETLLSYPNFSLPFDIHTDASQVQLGSVISQNGKPIAFYSRKLNPAQTRYTTTERELLAIVETLKEFRNILLGQVIKVYTDHKNLTYTHFNTDRVMRWRLILEEFGVELLHLPGTTNLVADALSRLPMEATLTDVSPSFPLMAECYGLDDKDLDDSVYPLSFSLIADSQAKDKVLQRQALSDPAYSVSSFRGGDNGHQLILKHSKIVIPEPLQQRIVHWYHQQLCHPGETRTEQTIRQHFTWNNLKVTVHEICSKCDTCQRCKKSHLKYGHLPEKRAEAVPWDVLCVDLIGPYTLKRKGKKPLELWCITMIDPATGWFEMVQIPNKQPDTIANKVETTWLTRYPWPTKLIVDRGSEFLMEFAQMVEKDYGIHKKKASTRNPQANSILERVHQTLGNIIRTFTVQDSYLDEEDPWQGILAATMFALRATVHTTTQATPAQLVFGRDAILNVTFEADWNLIRERKQTLIRKNNQRENSKRKVHQYHVGDKVLLKKDILHAKFGSNPWEGPHTIVHVNDNGTIRLRMGAITDTVNIRRVKPYRH